MKSRLVNNITKVQIVSLAIIVVAVSSYTFFASREPKVYDCTFIKVTNSPIPHLKSNHIKGMFHLGYPQAYFEPLNYIGRISEINAYAQLFHSGSLNVKTIPFKIDEFRVCLENDNLLVLPNIPYRLHSQDRKYAPEFRARLVEENLSLSPSKAYSDFAVFLLLILATLPCAGVLIHRQFKSSI